MDQGFFYETVAPLLLIGVTSLICISTLTSEINFYTRLFKIKDPITGLPVFAQLQVTLACDACKEAGTAATCKHMLHLVPSWQSSARHERLKAVMADRPDLIQSELSGLAFDSLQQCFRTADIEAMLAAEPPQPLTWAQPLFIAIDPAAGGPQSDFALVSFFRHRGQIVVRSRARALARSRARVLACSRFAREDQERMYSTLSSRSSSSGRIVSLTRNRGTMSARSACRKRAALCGHTARRPCCCSSSAQNRNLAWKSSSRKKRQRYICGLSWNRASASSASSGHSCSAATSSATRIVMSRMKSWSSE